MLNMVVHIVTTGRYRAQVNSLQTADRMKTSIRLYNNHIGTDVESTWRCMRGGADETPF